MRDKSDADYKNGWEQTYLIASCLGAKLKPLPWTKEKMSVEDWKELNKQMNAMVFKKDVQRN